MKLAQLRKRKEKCPAVGKRKRMKRLNIFLFSFLVSSHHFLLVVKVLVMFRLFMKLAQLRKRREKCPADIQPVSSHQIETAVEANLRL